MGFVQSFVGVIGGTFVESWNNFLTIPEDLDENVVFLPAVLEKNENYNLQLKNNLVREGTKVIVPEGYALITLKEGMLNSFITESGGYVFTVDENELDVQLIFTGDALPPALKNSWEKFKYDESMFVPDGFEYDDNDEYAFFVNFRRIKNNRFATDSWISWHNNFLNIESNTVVRGRFSLKVVDPLLFIKNFVPPTYTPIRSISEKQLDFSDLNNDVVKDFIKDFVNVIPEALEKYSENIKEISQLVKMDEDIVGFSNEVLDVIEDKYKWITDKGIMITRVVIDDITLDEKTWKAIHSIQKGNK